MIFIFVIAQVISSFSYEKNSPNDPLVIDYAEDIHSVVNLTNFPILLKQPLPKEKQGWNFSTSETEIYRQIAISYMGIRFNNEQLSISVVKIMPGDPIFPDLYSKEDCQYLSNRALSQFANNSSWEFSHAINLWKDLNQGVIGFENSKKIVSFRRIICLPKNIIDDIDMIGIEYAYATNNNVAKFDLDALKSGKALYLSVDDPRMNFRYDPVKFFERLEKYGVTNKFKVPNTYGREGWQESKWNTYIKMFPLETAVVFSE